jgi:hypothetical protein
MTMVRRCLAVVLALATVFVGGPAYAAGTLPGNYLGSDTLNPGFQMWGFSQSGVGTRGSEFILSQNQRLQFFAQNDSNLVIYDTGLANWAINRDRLRSIPFGRTLVGSYLVMRQDGNLAFVGLSASNVDGTCCLQTDMWTSGTSGHPFSRLVMQNDGNLVVYDTSNRPTWWVSKPGSGFVQLRS